MITWTTKRDEFWNGIFATSYFENADHKKEMEICIDGSSVTDYAEKCVRSFNALPDSVVREICKGILQCSKSHGRKWTLNAFRLKKHPLDILNYCYFSSVYVNTPTDENRICYIVEGEAEWNDVIGFVMNDNQLVYVGTDYLNEENWG